MIKLCGSESSKNCPTKTTFEEEFSTDFLMALKLIKMIFICFEEARISNRQTFFCRQNSFFLKLFIAPLKTKFLNPIFIRLLRTSFSNYRHQRAKHNLHAQATRLPRYTCVRLTSTSAVTC